MPVLRQDESYLIGTAQAIKALGKKDKAYVLVISDSHGDYDRFYALLEAYGSKLDALIFAATEVLTSLASLKLWQMSHQIPLCPIKSFLPL